MPAAPLMPIDDLPDWDRRLARQDACWEGEILGRPVVAMWLRRPGAAWPEKRHATIRDRWLDTEFVVEAALASVASMEYLGDALPHIYPNLGPEVFSAFFGCEIEFGDDTSWSLPCLHDWAEVEQVRFDDSNFYWRKLLEMTDALLAAGRGKFYTGMTDWHPGGDAIAAFRDPLQLNYDMVEAREQVEALLLRVNETYLRVYDFYYDKLTAAGQAVSSWPSIVSTKKWYVPSNDFSCMISSKLFDEVFLPGIAEECRHYEACVYHLDGPDALRHLDSLLSIPELRMIQWVYGAGNGRPSDWMPAYKRVQAAGKGLELGISIDELDLFLSELHPQGVWLGVSGVRDREQAEAVIRRIETWR